MAGKAPTPWERAKADSNTFQGVSPRAAAAVVSATTALLAQVVFGWPEGKVTPYAITVGSAVLGAVLLSVGELVINWWRAPTLMLLDEVREVRTRVGGARPLPATGSPPETPTPNVRLWMLEAVRRGKGLSQPGRGVLANAVEAWTQEVVEFLTVHGTPEETEQFVTAEGYLQGRIRMLEVLAEDRRGDT